MRALLIPLSLLIQLVCCRARIAWVAGITGFSSTRVARITWVARITGVCSTRVTRIAWVTRICSTRVARITRVACSLGSTRIEVGLQLKRVSAECEKLFRAPCQRFCLHWCQHAKVNHFINVNCTDASLLCWHCYLMGVGLSKSCVKQCATTVT